MKTFPIGISDFKNIIDRGYYLIDKTLLIEELLSLSPEVILILRPRRFGKTLNLSMLKYFFEKTPESHAYLFHHTNIWRSETARRYQGQFPLIYLTFKDIKPTNWESAYEMLARIISEEFLRHKYLYAYLNEQQTLREAHIKDFEAILNRRASISTLQASLIFLSSLLSEYHNQKVMILLDEYDTPFRVSFAHGYYEDMTNFMSILLSSALKDNNALERCILTGILRIAKEGIFSGLNNVSVHSFLDNDFGDKFGFTQEEVDQLLIETKLEEKKVSIREWYNSYKCGHYNLYNPWSLINCIQHQGRLATWWINSTDNDMINNLLIEADAPIKASMSLLMQGETVEKHIKQGVIFPDLTNDSENIWNLLFYTGYLTYTECDIKGGGPVCYLRIPNREMLSLYDSSFSSLLLNHSQKLKLPIS